MIHVGKEERLENNELSIHLQKLVKRTAETEKNLITQQRLKKINNTAKWEK